MKKSFFVARDCTIVIREIVQGLLTQNELHHEKLVVNVDFPWLSRCLSMEIKIKDKDVLQYYRGQLSKFLETFVLYMFNHYGLLKEFNTSLQEQKVMLDITDEEYRILPQTLKEML